MTTMEKILLLFVGIVVLIALYAFFNSNAWPVVKDQMMQLLQMKPG